MDLATSGNRSQGQKTRHMLASQFDTECTYQNANQKPGVVYILVVYYPEDKLGPCIYVAIPGS